MSWRSRPRRSSGSSTRLRDTMVGMEPQASPLRTAGTAGAAILWYLILSAHLFLAIGWWFLMPGGFPAEHSRFWTNRVFPIALSVAVIAASVGARNSRLEWRRATLIALGCGWFAAVVAVCVIYPRSALRGAPAPSLVVLFIIAAAFTKPLRAVRLPRRLLALILPAAAIGMLMTLAQRAPLPQTKPLNESTPTVAS